MKVKLQTLKNATHELEVAETDTVAKVRTFCENDLKLGSNARIIFNGQVLLNNEATFASLNMTEGAVLVIIPSKKKKSKAKKTTSTAPAPVTTAPAPVTTAPTPVPTPTTTTTAPTTTTTTTPSTTTTTPAPTTTTETNNNESKTTTTQDAASSLVTGDAYQGMVANLMGLGYSHQQVTDALKAAYNNPDRAAEYLFSGNIPTQPQQQPQQVPQQGQQQPQVQQPQQGDNSQGMPQLGDGQMPDSQQMMAALAQNPQLMTTLLQQLGQSNPELAQQLANNPEQMMQLLQMVMSGQMPGGMGGQGGPPEGQGMTVQLTQAEAQSIANLEALGFERQAALQAFIICDRNEELAANYLFDQQ